MIGTKPQVRTDGLTILTILTMNTPVQNRVIAGLTAASVRRPDSEQ